MEFDRPPEGVSPYAEREFINHAGTEAANPDEVMIEVDEVFDEEQHSENARRSFMSSLKEGASEFITSRKELLKSNKEVVFSGEFYQKEISHFEKARTTLSSKFSNSVAKIYGHLKAGYHTAKGEQLEKKDNIFSIEKKRKLVRTLQIGIAVGGVALKAIEIGTLAKTAGLDMASERASEYFTDKIAGNAKKEIMGHGSLDITGSANVTATYAEHFLRKLGLNMDMLFDTVGSTSDILSSAFQDIENPLEAGNATSVINSINS